MLNFFICFYLYDVHSLKLPAIHICRRHLFYYLFCFLLSDFLFFNIFDITILAAIITIPVNILLLIVISYFKKNHIISRCIYLCIQCSIKFTAVSINSLAQNIYLFYRSSHLSVIVPGISMSYPSLPIFILLN
jgi:hypothetical protein